MASRSIPLVREAGPPLIRDEPAFPVELARELDVLRNHSLSLLMAFLALHEVSASHALAAATLALLVYTINLHIAANSPLLHSSPLLSRFLHCIPLLGVICMAIFKLVIIVQSTPITVAVLLACALPLLSSPVPLAKWYAKASWVTSCTNAGSSSC